MPRRIRLPRGAGLLLAIPLLATPPLSSQTTDLDAPASSSHWWTLTEEITPAELKAIHRDVEGHQRRYLEAVALGLERPISDEQLARLCFHIDGNQNPEYFTLWEAFNAFANRFDSVPKWDESVRSQLTKYGISDRAIERISVLSHAHLYEKERLVAELKDKQLAFAEILRIAQERVGRDLYQEALASNLETITQATGRNAQELTQLHLAWKRRPIAERATANLELLRADVTKEEWDLFRLYLRKEIATRMSALDFDYSGDAP